MINMRGKKKMSSLYDTKRYSFKTKERAIDRFREMYNLARSEYGKGWIIKDLIFWVESTTPCLIYWLKKEKGLWIIHSQVYSKWSCETTTKLIRWIKQKERMKWQRENK